MDCERVIGRGQVDGYEQIANYVNGLLATPVVTPGRSSGAARVSPCWRAAVEHGSGDEGPPPE